MSLAPILMLAAVGIGSLNPAARAAGEEGKGGEDASAYRTLDRLNAGLPRPDNPPDLETPQSTLECFIGSCDAGDYARAAHALNLNAIEAGRQDEAGRALARELKSVMDQQVWFQWADVPDRPDGQEDGPRPKIESVEPSGPRSSFLLYRLYIGDHDYEIRLERVKTATSPPVWVFSRQTVEHIPTLYREFHPGRLEDAVPGFLRHRRIFKVALWQWIGFAVLLATGGALSWAVQRGLEHATRRWESPWVRATAEAIRGPGALAIGLCTFYTLARRLLELAGPILSVLEPFYVAIVVACLVWFLQRLIRLISNRISRRYEGANSNEANALITRIVVLRHVLILLVVCLGAAYVLSGFEWVRKFGTAILASAGVAGIVLGVAAQRVLGNFVSGLLLAVTQPVKAGDAIIFEQDFGWIEEIGITYLVIRTWDLRRLVVPLSYFMDRPLQNWSRTSQQIIKPVVVHADYRVDVGAVRAELERILGESDLWDEEVPPILQVTGCDGETIELRALCSAKDPAASWDLQCLVRERLVGFIRGLDDGRYLPRRRVALVDDAAPDGRAGAGDGAEADAAPARTNGKGRPAPARPHGTAELQELDREGREERDGSDEGDDPGRGSGPAPAEHTGGRAGPEA